MNNSSLQIINIMAILLSPIIAVIITLLYQITKSKHDDKMNLFITLMANRKSFPPPYSAVNAMNTIDIIFYKNKSVIDCWHKYYDSLHLHDRTPWFYLNIVS